MNGCSSCRWIKWCHPSDSLQDSPAVQNLNTRMKFWGPQCRNFYKRNAQNPNSQNLSRRYRSIHTASPRKIQQTSQCCPAQEWPACWIFPRLHQRYSGAEMCKRVWFVLSAYSSNRTHRIFEVYFTRKFPGMSRNSWARANDRYARWSWSLSLSKRSHTIMLSNPSAGSILQIEPWFEFNHSKHRVQPTWLNQRGLRQAQPPYLLLSGPWACRRDHLCGFNLAQPVAQTIFLWAAIESVLFHESKRSERSVTTTVWAAGEFCHYLSQALDLFKTLLGKRKGYLGNNPLN